MSNVEFNFTTVLKFGGWAESLPDDIDFLDYWYNLFLSKTKAQIESSILDNINAFHWTRWREEFEEYIDGYKPIPGNGYDSEIRLWFGEYMQYLVYGLDTPSFKIASHYKKDVFQSVFDDWFVYHTFGVDQFIENFTERFGLPPGVNSLVALHM